MNRILLVGVPRSGTSWTGRVIGRANDTVFSHEPDGDNEPFAVRAKRGHALHIALEPGDSAPDYERLWRGAFAGGERLPNLRARAAKRLFDPTTLAERGRARRRESIPLQLRVALALAVPPGEIAGAHNVVVKSVHATFAIDWIIDKFEPTVVLMERDVRNVMASWMRLNMGATGADHAAIVAQAKARWGLTAPPGDAPKIVRRAFVLGTFMSAWREAAARHGNWVRATHEELCVDSVARFQTLLARLGLEMSPDATAYLEQSNREGSGFRTQRLTADEPEKWRRELSDDDVAAVRAELERFPFELTRGW